MIIYFKNLSAVKKDAALLRKIIKKHAPSLRPSPTETQDLVASMYGWKNYNRISQCTSDFIRTGSVSIFGAKCIDDLSISEKLNLDLQKKEVLSRFLSFSSSKKIETDSIFESFFTRNSNSNKLEERNKKNININNLNGWKSVPNHAFKDHFVLYSENSNDIFDFIINVPFPEAVSNGGTFILRESIAKKLLDKIYLIKDLNKKINSFYFGKKDLFVNDIDLNSYKINDKTDEEFYIPEEYRNINFDEFPFYKKDNISIIDALISNDLNIIIIPDKRNHHEYRSDSRMIKFFHYAFFQRVILSEVSKRSEITKEKKPLFLDPSLSLLGVKGLSILLKGIGEIGHLPFFCLSKELAKEENLYLNDSINLSGSRVYLDSSYEDAMINDIESLKFYDELSDSFIKYSKLDKENFNYFKEKTVFDLRSGYIILIFNNLVFKMSKK